MNIEEYISSGILELYVMGSLTQNEIIEVEKNILLYPKIKNEVIEIELALENLSLQNNIIEPPAFNKDFILINSKILNSTKISTKNINKTKIFDIYKFAASIIIVGLLGLTLNFYLKYNNLKKEVSILTKINQANSNKLGIYESKDFVRIKMNNTDSNLAPIENTIIWNKNTSELYLNWERNSLLKENEQFQLWAIVNGAPVDLGVFYEGQLLKMKNVSLPSAFAVTIEKKGGSKSPTLNKMVVFGKV